MNNQYLILSVCLIMVASQPTVAQTKSWKQAYEALDQHLSWDEYTVFYTKEELNAFPSQKIAIPLRKQYLEKLKAQIKHADQVYRTELGLTAPLRQPIYSMGRRIHIHILHQEKGMGAAGDRLVRYNYRHFRKSPRVLSITLTSRWIPPNRTPEHEVFHLYQYGYSFFKNSWYLEGLARSMGRFFTKDIPAVSEVILPMNSASLDDVIDSGPEAAIMWSRLAVLCDEFCAATDTNRVSAYVGRNSPVFGGSIVRPLLEALNVEDDRAAQDRGIDPVNWPENEQRSAANNIYIFAAVKKVLESSCPLDTSPELRGFRDLLAMKVNR